MRPTSVQVTLEIGNNFDSSFYKRYIVTILMVSLFSFRSSTDELIDCGEHGVCLEAVGRLIWN